MQLKEGNSSLSDAAPAVCPLVTRAVKAGFDRVLQLSGISARSCRGLSSVIHWQPARAHRL